MNVKHEIIDYGQCNSECKIGIQNLNVGRIGCKNSKEWHVNFVNGPNGAQQMHTRKGFRVYKIVVKSEPYLQPFRVETDAIFAT